MKCSGVGRTSTTARGLQTPQKLLCSVVGRTPTSARGRQTPQFSCRQPDLEIQRGTGVPPHHNEARA